MKKEIFICPYHINDKFLIEFIEKNGSRNRCKYCEKVQQSIDILQFANFIESCIEIEYDDPYALGAPFDSEGINYEDRFPGIKVYTSDEVLEREIDFNSDDDWQVIQDISSNFGNAYWSEKESIWGPTKEEYISGGWDSFKNILKHKIRFVFFNDKFKNSFEDEYGQSLNPYKVLEEIGNAISKCNLIVKIPKRELQVYRAIQHDNSILPEFGYQLGSPPSDKAKANRMSPPGISMFYGALDRETCQIEVQKLDWHNSIISIGKFLNLKTLVLVDFTKLTSVPSIFDDENRNLRSMSKFLISFLNDFSVPVSPDDKVHIEYIPTQVVTEYLKFILGGNKAINGIIYYSVKNPSHKCIVIFAENDEITEIEVIDDMEYAQYLYPNKLDWYIAKEKFILALDTKSITRINIK